MKLYQRLNTIYHYEQFQPGFWGFIFNPFYFYRKGLCKTIRKLAPEIKGKVLDYGCGSKPYQKLFFNADSYTGIDIENPGHDHSGESIDVFFDGEKIPFDDQTFDSVFCSEVLEHVVDLELAIQEIRRVLKPDGTFLVTVPFVWGEHEMPHDYRRFSQNGIYTFLEKNHFQIVDSYKISNHLETIFQLWNMYIYSYFENQNKHLRLVLCTLFIFPFTALGCVLRILLPVKKGLYLGNVIMCKKLAYESEK